MARTDPLVQQQELTVQSRTRQENLVGIGMLMWLAQSGEILAPWWSKARDRQLRDTATQSDHFQSAEWMIADKIASIPKQVVPRDMSMKAHIKLADQYNIILSDLIQGGDGWSEFWHMFFYDLWETDNGGFGEVIGEGDPGGPIEGPALGLRHLDSYRCSRSSNPVYPVHYQDTDGKYYRFHHTRVIYRSQKRSSIAEMNGVGHSWLSRSINVAQNLIDIGVYKQEKLGSRPIRGFLKGKGIETKQIIDAVRMSEEGMDNQGLRRFAKLIMLGSTQTDWDLELMDFASLPDGFDERTSVELGMFLIALAGGFPPRWLWPASQTGATKADAMYSHVAGSGGGLTWHLDMMRSLLSINEHAVGLSNILPFKFLPPSLKLVFDYQDDEQDRLQAGIKKTRAERRKVDLETQVVDIRTAREQAVSSGDLTPQQFANLELDDGRLPNGDDVLTLFSSTDDLVIEMLDLGVDDPLAIDANDPVDMMLEIEAAALDAQDRLVSAGSRPARQKFQQVIASLGKLKELYQELVVQEIQAEQAAALASEEAAMEESKEPPASEEETPEEELEEEPPPDEEEKALSVSEMRQAVIVLNALEPLTNIVARNDFSACIDTVVKGFNFGAKVGEVISGQLARGAGGQFVSASELSAQRSELLAAILGKINAKRGAGGRKGASAGKREANREKVAGKVDAGEGTLDGLASLRTGDAVDAGTLASMQARGLAETLPSGDVAMSAAGRSLLNAANAGDVDRAKKALAKAGAGKGGKKPKGGGKAPKPSKAEVAEQERVEESQKRTQASADTGVDFNSLAAFSEGGELVGDVATGLAQSGLVEFDADGNARMTSNGRSALRAASAGEAGKLRDAMSKAGERVDKVRERASDKSGQVDKRREKSAELADDADKLEASLEAFVGEEAQADRIRAKVADMRERAAKETERADEIAADVEDLLARIGEGGVKEKTLSPQPALCGTLTKQADDDGPPRGDFEDLIADNLEPIFDIARDETLAALDRGEEPDYDELRKRLITLLVPLLTSAALFSIEGNEEEFQIFFGSADLQQQILEWAEPYANQRATQLVTTTRNIASRAMSQVEEGATEEEVEQTVDRAFDETRRNRIGKTEATVALTLGALLYQRLVKDRLNVDLEAIWFTRLDERVCPICAPLHNTKKDVWSQQFPGGPPAHVQCRCGTELKKKRRRGA